MNLKSLVYFSSFSLLVLLTTSCEQSRKLPVEKVESEASESPKIQPTIYSLNSPIRRAAPEVQSRDSVVNELYARIAVLPEDVYVNATSLEKGGRQVEVRVKKAYAAQSQITENLESHSFKLKEGSGEAELIFERRLRNEDADAFALGLMKQLNELEEEQSKFRKFFSELHEPARLAIGPSLNENQAGGKEALWKNGKLVFTGLPLDLSLPESGEYATYFLPVRTTGNLVNGSGKRWANGSEVFVRGGSLYVDRNSQLRVKAGVIQGLSQVPQNTEAIRISANGEVTAFLSDQEKKDLGRIKIVKVKQVAGDGKYFFVKRRLSEKAYGYPGQVADETLGVSEFGLLNVGHLEYAVVDKSKLIDIWLKRQRMIRALSAIEKSFAKPTPLPPQPPRLEIQPKADPGFPFDQLVIVNDLTMSKKQMVTLGITPVPGAGRMTINLGKNALDRQKVAECLDKVLLGLTTQMKIFQQNYDNAEKAYNEKGENKPYIRRIPKVTPLGFVEEEVDPNNKPKTGKDPKTDGQIDVPDISRVQEKEDFLRAAQEYQQLKTALERLAPNIVFPDAPAFREIATPASE